MAAGGDDRPVVHDGPGARSVSVVSGDRRFPLDPVVDGLFAGTLPAPPR